MVSSPATLLPGEAMRLGDDGCALWRDTLVQVQSGLQALPDKPEETAVATLRALWHLAAGEPMSARAAMGHELPTLDAGQRELLRDLVARRLAGTPLAYLTGRQSFMGVEMIAAPGALIPRGETELLGAAAVTLLHQLTQARDHIIVVDACTGSGNLAGALALAEPGVVVYASDLSAEAVDLARRNMAFLGLEDRVTLEVGDLLAPFCVNGLLGQVDLLTCNPPYISSGRVAGMPSEIAAHEPSVAFDGGPLGVRILQRLIRESPQLLRPGGWLAFEVGAGQGPAVEHRLHKANEYGRVERVLDARGEVRALLAQRAMDT